jgi:hypothetical protein
MINKETKKVIWFDARPHPALSTVAEARVFSFGIFRLF